MTGFLKHGTVGISKRKPRNQAAKKMILDPENDQNRRHSALGRVTMINAQLIKGIHLGRTEGSLFQSFTCLLPLSFSYYTVFIIELQVFLLALQMNGPKLG